ncbi:MAG: 2-amino-4-hydroxy-6-hydroxymethyldihydropteridine diphosphokinase [Candidatus Caenarcaniphilales bacterium]|nr:2-amino-4-hydroxy-6-hydroxymethyldihydropteridine diphosphokinase [Candidatus Caenarcaniphilales bacterium]
MKADLIVYLALGSNLGDPKSQILSALDALGDHPQIELEAVSELISSPAEGLAEIDPPPFLNAIARLKTTLSPFDLLAFCQSLERRAGRRRDPKVKLSRELDLDLIYHEGFSLNTPELTLPHPRLRERLFVTIPLKEVLLPEHFDLIDKEVFV